MDPISDTSDPRLGAVVAGRYRLDRSLAEDGSGNLFLATQLELKRPVALKFVTDDDSPAERRTRVRDALVLTGRLSQPHSTRLLDFGDHEDAQFVVFELLHGTDLARHIARNGALEPKIALQIAREIALALEEAHSLGLVHRAIVARNVFLLQRHGDPLFVKVTDFGSAQITDEQLAETDPQTDLHGLGRVLGQMLTGDSTRDTGPQPAAVQSLLDDLLGKRISTANAAIQRIDAAISGKVMAAAPPPSAATKRSARDDDAETSRKGLIAVGVFSLLALLIWWATSGTYVRKDLPPKPNVSSK